MSPMIIIGVVLALVGIGAFAMWPRSAAETSAAPVAASPAPADQANPAPKMAKAEEPTPAIIAATEAQVKLGPHKQATLPPIPFRGYDPPRPVEVVTAAFHFTAEHPEISSGCQQGGHKGNTDCFVRSRDASGDVVEWEEHGLECAVCIDVATRSRQMFASGASVRDIRAAVEKEFGPSFTTMTPTPKPPAAGETHDH
jgi:hypothetical protein